MLKEFILHLIFFDNIEIPRYLWIMETYLASHDESDFMELMRSVFYIYAL